MCNTLVGHVSCMTCLWDMSCLMCDMLVGHVSCMTCLWDMSCLVHYRHCVTFVMCNVLVGHVSCVTLQQVAALQVELGKERSQNRRLRLRVAAHAVVLEKWRTERTKSKHALHTHGMGKAEAEKNEKEAGCGDRDVKEQPQPVGREQVVRVARQEREALMCRNDASILGSAPKTISELKSFLGIKFFRGPRFVFQKQPSKLIARDGKVREVRPAEKLLACLNGGHHANGARFLPATRLGQSSSGGGGHGLKCHIGIQFLILGQNYRNKTVVMTMELKDVCESMEEAVSKTPGGLYGLVGTSGKDGERLFKRAIKSFGKGQHVLFKPQQIWPVRSKKQWKHLMDVKGTILE